MVTSPAETSSSAPPARYDVAVLGAGPAGLAATVGVAGVRGANGAGGRRHAGGRSVLAPPDGDDGTGHHHWPVRWRGCGPRSPGRDLLGGHAVWHAERTDDGFTLHTTTTVDGRCGLPADPLPDARRRHGRL